MGSIPQTCKTGHQTPDTGHIMLALLLVCVSPLLVTAEGEQPAEISDEELKSINKANDLSLNEAFRCGLFFPPEVEGELPIAPLYIFNASFPATECPTENTDRFNSFCHSIWTKILKYIVYTGPSIKKGKNKIEGHTMGDDICGLSKKKSRHHLLVEEAKNFPRVCRSGCTPTRVVLTSGRIPRTDTQRGSAAPREGTRSVLPSAV